MHIEITSKLILHIEITLKLLQDDHLSQSIMKNGWSHYKIQNSFISIYNIKCTSLYQRTGFSEGLKANLKAPFEFKLNTSNRLRNSLLIMEN